jgi:ATP-dependent Clp protease ATP-binding subunit ClpC
VKVPEIFTSESRTVFLLAQEEAHILSHASIGAEHLLLGLLRATPSNAAEFLQSKGLSLEVTRERIRELGEPSSSRLERSLPFTPQGKDVLVQSRSEAEQLGRDFILPADILLAVIADGRGVSAALLEELGTDRLELHRELIETLSTYP